MKREKINKEEIKEKKSRMPKEVKGKDRKNKKQSKENKPSIKNKEKIEKSKASIENKESKYHKYLWYLIIFSILGLLLETIFCLLGEKIFGTGAGLVLGPLCIIYGIGAIITIICLKRFQGHKIKLFISGAILGTAIEYMMGFIIEAIFGARLWNCSWAKFNVNGRVCLEHSILWGIMAVILINLLIKHIEKIIGKIQGKVRIVVDIIVTIAIVFFIMFTSWGIITYTVRARETLEGKNYISNNNAIEKFQNTVFSNDVMEKIFPRMEIIDNAGNTILVKNIDG